MKVDSTRLKFYKAINLAKHLLDLCYSLGAEASLVQSNSKNKAGFRFEDAAF